jgi:hypothetical protein
MESNNAGTIVAIILAAGLMITAAISVPIYTYMRWEYQYMQLGYCEKIVVVGDPNNSMTRHYESVWAPKDATNADLLIEKKQ